MTITTSVTPTTSHHASKQDVMRDKHLSKYSLPSPSLAMTIPLPALAEKRKPALKMVKMANPFAFSSTLRGMTYMQNEHILFLEGFEERTPSRPLLPLSTKDLTRRRQISAESTPQVRRNIHIVAAFKHSLCKGWGSGVLNFIRRRGCEQQGRGEMRRGGGCGRE